LQQEFQLVGEIRIEQFRHGFGFQRLLPLQNAALTKGCNDSQYFALPVTPGSDIGFHFRNRSLFGNNNRAALVYQITYAGWQRGGR